MQVIDTSAELIIVPYKDGVKLEQLTAVNAIYTKLSDAMALPCNFWISNINSECIAANESMIISLKVDSINRVLGKTVLDFCRSEEALLVIENDRKVICSERPLIADEIGTDKNGNQANFLSIKIPFYNNENNLAGILGFSILLGYQPLAESLALITKMRLTNLIHTTPKKFSSDANSAINGINLTDRQWQVITLVVRGFSAAKIADQLGLSKRTVEHYIDAIKIKLKVSSKAQLIQKMLEENE